MNGRNRADEINRTTKLAELAPDLRQHGHYHTGPCPFCGGEDRFTVKHTGDGDLWHCRGCGGEKYQDAVAFLMRRDGRSFADVVDPGSAGAEPLPQLSVTARVPDAATVEPPTEEWQTAALVGLRPALKTLWGRNPVGEKVRRYLYETRGLGREVCWAASLGFNPDWQFIDGIGWLAPGIVIPGQFAGDLWYVRVRTTRTARGEAARKGKPLGKYTALRGSRMGLLYNARALMSAHTAVLVEGEFDALLLGQHLPEGWAAVTLGSAAISPERARLAALALVARVLVCFDDDEAGREALARWRRRLPGIEPLPLPPGHNDVTDYWRAGGDLAAWVDSQIVT